MPIDISVVSGLSYFRRPQCDFSLVLVKPEIIAIQMFVGEHDSEMKCTARCKRWKIGWKESTALSWCTF